MKILIATPLYPPDIGGPAQYAFNLKDQFEKQGHRVRVVRFSFEKKLPSMIRHCFYFLRIFPSMLWADRLLAFDASSVGIPAIAASSLLKRRSVIRLGGDFLWEQYVERTGSEISLHAFYGDMPRLSMKEKLMKKMIGHALRNASAIAVNTPWLIDIFIRGYQCDPGKINCIENYFGGVSLSKVKEMTFIASSRSIALKNIDRLKRVFKQLPFVGQRLILESATSTQFEHTIADGYATAVVSFSDVSPNLVLEGISKGKPFLLTKHTGLHERFKDMGVTVDPFDEESIKRGFMLLLDKSAYERYVAAISSCQYAHSWESIASEFEALLV